MPTAARKLHGGRRLFSGTEWAERCHGRRSGAAMKWKRSDVDDGAGADVSDSGRKKQEQTTTKPSNDYVGQSEKSAIHKFPIRK